MKKIFFGERNISCFFKILKYFIPVSYYNRKTVAVLRKILLEIVGGERYIPYKVRMICQGG